MRESKNKKVRRRRGREERKGEEEEEEEEEKNRNSGVEKNNWKYEFRTGTPYGLFFPPKKMYGTGIRIDI